MTSIERFKEYLENKGISNARAEKDCGFSNGLISNAYKTKTAMGSDKIEKILTVYTDLSAEWLLRGTGGMISTERPNRKTSVSNLKQRLIEFIKYKDLSQQKFESRCGLSNGYVNNITRGIGAEKLADISRQFPELNTDWLITGAGEMLNESNDNYMIVETRPRVPFKSITGHLRDYYAGDKRDECEMKPIVKQFPHYQFTMLISRHVMSPYIDTGDVIACAEIPKITAYGHVYVLDTEGDVLIRRVYVADGDPNQYRLVAENKDYPDLVIDKSDVNGIYRIVGMLRVEI